MKDEEELEELEASGKTCADCSRYDVCRLPGGDQVLCFSYEEDSTVGPREGAPGRRTAR